MESLFSEADSAALIAKHADCPEDLALRVYTSRIIGSDRNLVLHGGGNTSVKGRLKNILGEESDVIFVKGSGFDLSTIKPEEFTGLNLHPLQKLRRLESLSDEQMEDQLTIHRISGRSPDPSVETFVHAFLPHKFVDHTHANSILVLTHQQHGVDLIKDVLGTKVAVIPYIISGFPLAKAVIEEYERTPDIDAMVVMNHGIFTFAANARISYETMIEYVNRAETYIKKRLRGKSLLPPCADTESVKICNADGIRCVQTIRGSCAHTNPEGKLQRFYVEVRTTRDLIEASLSKDAEKICHSGVLTPDHAIHTKNNMAYIESIPQDDETLKQNIRQAVNTFIKNYRQYLSSREKAGKIDHNSLNPYPKLFLVAGLGLISLGPTLKEARLAADIGEQTIRAKLGAMALGQYVPIADEHVLDMEFWSFQQKKLDRSIRLPLQGQVAVVTGGGGAIGFGIAKQLLAAGAVVVLCDIDQPRLQKACSMLADHYDKTSVEQMIFDVTDYSSVEKAFDDISIQFGGIDIVVPNAGSAHVAKIEDLDPEILDRIIAVNLKGTFTVIKASIPVFKRQGTGGNIVVISSKNVFDPGVAFGAYSASKAGAHQISKIAAMELAELGVRVNMINPDAVFGDDQISSKLWELVGPERMKSRGLAVEDLKEYYRQRSLLKQRVSAEHIGNAVVFFAEDLTPTTGAALPVDAGNSAAFPR